MTIDNTALAFDSRVSIFKLNDGSTIRDISNSVTGVTFPATWKANDITTYGKVGVVYKPSLDDSKFTLDMIWNQVANTGSQNVVGSMHYAQGPVGNTTNTRAFEYYPAGATAGNLNITGNCWCPHYEIIGKVGNALAVRAELLVDNGVTFGAAA